MKLRRVKEDALAILSLFASTSTLLCCALPTLLVTLGFGTVVAGTVAAFPWLGPLSRHKAWVFLVAGVLIAGNWMLLRRREREAAACPLPDEAVGAETACATASRWARGVLWASTLLYAVGFTVAYVAFPVGARLGLW